MSPLSILCIGDIVGRPGRQLLIQKLAEIQDEHNIDFTIANLENAASGFGITKKTYAELAGLSIQAFTSGNHIYAQRDSLSYFDSFTKLVRPLNYPPNSPGVGVRSFSTNGTSIAIVNLIGQVFMAPVDCPFQAITNCLDTLKKENDIVIVDFHTEATSEIQAMGWHLTEKASCVFGTHTHVMTADDHILDDYTAYISDIGMVGSGNSILGMEKSAILSQFTTHISCRKKPSLLPPYIFNAIKIDVDPKTGQALSIKRIQKSFSKLRNLE